MDLKFSIESAKNYLNKSQIARILTENWVVENLYCPSCDNSNLQEYENNRPVADFYCAKCNEEFELKSKSGKISKLITDGAYSKMIERINSENNPNLFFLTYTKEWSVNNFFIVPKHFFTSEIIIRRPPLTANARRAGWVGCNIDISKVSELGKIFLIKDSKIIDKEFVRETFNKTLFLRDKSQSFKGWILDIMNCLDSIRKEVFTLEDVYKFEEKLKLSHPNNSFIKDKIRQQLQILRDKNIIEFKGRGIYRKLYN